MVQLGSKLGRLNGQVERFHIQQVKRESAQNQLKEQIDNAMQDQVWATYLQQPVTKDSVQPFARPMFKKQKKKMRTSSHSGSADIYNDYLRTAASNYTPHESRQRKTIANTSKKPSFQSLTEHQMNKLEKLKASRTTQRMFTKTSNEFEMRDTCSSKFDRSSMPSATGITTFKESDATLGSQYRPKGKKKTRGKPERVETEVARSETPMLSNLSHSLNFKFPISEDHMTKYREASAIKNQNVEEECNNIQVTKRLTSGINT